jgi:CBS domain-containing protein
VSSRRFYETQVATVPADASARVIAEHMALYAVGCVVVVDEERRPIGVVTDRDLACRVVARGADPGRTTAGEIASKPVQLAQSDESIETVVQRMRQAGVRRMPVVENGALVGLVAIDDLVVHLGRELDELGRTAKQEVDEARRHGRRVRRRQELEESLAALEASALAAGRDAAAFVRREIDALRERVRGSQR